MVKLTHHKPIETTDPESPCSGLPNPPPYIKQSVTGQKSLTRKLFILGFLLPPVIPWVLCIAIVKFKPAAKTAEEDQYWAFLCMVALLVVLTSAGGAVLMLGVELGWFRSVAV